MGAARFANAADERQRGGGVSALQKLKAYFGMVPADEMDEYEDDRYSGYGSAYSPAASRTSTRTVTGSVLGVVH